MLQDAKANYPVNECPVSPLDFMFTAPGSSVRRECEHETPVKMCRGSVCPSVQNKLIKLQV